MNGVNKLILMGRLGQDAVLAYLPSGSAVLEFSLAINDSYQDKAGKRVTSTVWYRCKIFGKRGESLSKLLIRGTPLYVEGKGKTRSWTSKTGEKKESFEVFVDEVAFIGDTRESGVEVEKTSVTPNALDLGLMNEGDSML